MRIFTFNVPQKKQEDILIGFLSLRYAESKIDLSDFLHLAWESPFHYHEAFELYEQESSLRQKGQSTELLRQKIDAIFFPYLNLARETLDTLLDLNSNLSLLQKP